MSLKNVKVGDWIKVQVTEIVENRIYETIADRIYPIKCSGLSLTMKGELLEGAGQIAFPLEPTERWMMVSDDGKDWLKRKVIMKKNGKFLAWRIAESDEEVLRTSIITGWKYAKEIEECPVEITLEDIAEKFGVDVNLIKIKK